MSKFAKLSQVKKNADTLKQLLEEDLKKIKGGLIALPPYVEYYGVVMYGLPPW